MWVVAHAGIPAQFIERPLHCGTAAFFLQSALTRAELVRLGDGDGTGRPGLPYLTARVTFSTMRFCSLSLRHF